MRRSSAFRQVIFILLCLATLMVSSGSISQATGQTSADPPVLLGTYVRTYVDQDTLEQEVLALDQWTGKKSSIIGMMQDFEKSPATIPLQLDRLWNAGYTPFINLAFGAVSDPSAYQIAIGEKDAAITEWAKAIASWAVSGKWLYIAPLPEMNTSLVSYGRQPINFQFSYSRIRQIFAQNGVSDTDVRWVFAPNAWTGLIFENYYPGDDLVDVVGFSAFNQGYCRESNTSLWYWNPPDSTFGFYIKKMNQMAPTKPIFITRAATTSETVHDVSDPAAKNRWLQDAYAYLGVQHGVQAVIYYNTAWDQECDWPIYEYGTLAYDGYLLGVQNPAYGYISPSDLAILNFTASIEGDNFIPNVSKGVTGSQADILLGMYTQNWTGLQRVMVNEVQAVDLWSGKHLSIVGTFVDFTSNPSIEIELQLEVIWENGYTPFLNLGTHNTLFTARRIAQGDADSYLRAVATSYAIYAKKGLQSAYVAPLYEMNASWAPYSGDPVNFILAFKRIQQIFTDAGVPDESVSWVFAPNGSWEPGTPEMEKYYPGDAYVDYIGMTAYHFGYCDGVAPIYQGWVTPVDTFNYIYRLIALAPEKKIFIAQTGTSSETYYGYNDTAKSAWLFDMYTYLSSFDQLHGIIYYNRWDADCDWAFFNPYGKQYDGYRQGISNGLYGYFPPYQQSVLFFP